MKIPQVNDADICDDLTTELVVVGRFQEEDEEELCEKFGKFGKVLELKPGSDARFAPNAVVTIEGRGAAEAMRQLNLTRMGTNVMCKVKLASNLLNRK